MATLTQNMIQELNTVDFLTAEQAAALAKQAFADYSKRHHGGYLGHKSREQSQEK